MIDRCVEATVRARTHTQRYGPPSEERTLSMAEAYAVQDRVREALVSRGERLIGWKAGFTGKAAQEMFQCPEPVSAFLLGSGVYADRAEVPLGRFVQVVVEAEVALVLKRDLAGPGRHTPRGASGHRRGGAGPGTGGLSLLGQAHGDRRGGRRRLRQRHRAGGAPHRRDPSRSRPRGARVRAQRGGGGHQHRRRGLGQSHQLAGLDREPPRGAGPRARGGAGRDDGLRVEARASEGRRHRARNLHAPRVCLRALCRAMVLGLLARPGRLDA